jgi:hypothetical protein
MTLVYSFAGLCLVAVLLWLTGRRWIVREVVRHQTAIKEIVEYHNLLVQYAESRGGDTDAMNQLMIRSTRVEAILGADNWLSGARVVRNIYNGVPAIPFAIREIHETISNHLWQREAYQAAELVRNVLIRHVGRRESEEADLIEESKSHVRSIALGWRLWAAIPLYILNSFGLIGRSSLKRARASLLFSIYSLILFFAAVAAPILAYLADKNAIDNRLEAWIPWLQVYFSP